MARRGDGEAIALLRPPCECPEPLEYLYDWSNELEAWRTYHTEHGPNGTMLTVADGVAHTLDPWARMTGRAPTPIEVETLIQLDFIKRFPEDGDHDDAAEG